MQTSPAGRAAIARREGNVLKAYLDSVGVLTIGVGHTSAAGAPKVTKGMTITATQSDDILARDLAGVEAAVASLVKVPLNQNEFDALVSLVFNIGAGGFKSSSVLRNLNAGNRAGAADAMLAWNKGTIGGKKVALSGLTSRRKDERAQFLTPAPIAAPPEPVQPVPAPQMIPDKPAVVTVTQPDTGPPVIVVTPAPAEPVLVPAPTKSNRNSFIVLIIMAVSALLAYFGIGH
jgi:lysozyme